MWANKRAPTKKVAIRKRVIVNESNRQQWIWKDSKAIEEAKQNEAAVNSLTGQNWISGHHKQQRIHAIVAEEKDTSHKTADSEKHSVTNMGKQDTQNKNGSSQKHIQTESADEDEEELSQLNGIKETYSS